MSELTDCPRCGTHAEVVLGNHIRCANTYNCDCETRLGVEAWNRRSTPTLAQASTIEQAAQARIFAQYIIDRHEDLEDRAPVEVFCAECNLGTGPHKETCIPHQAEAFLK